MVNKPFWRENCFVSHMKNRIKNIFLKKLNGKKRYIAAMLIAMEVASLPAAAQIINKVSFQVRPTVTAVEIPTEDAGLSRFLVVSNAPFTVRSADIIGDVDVSVHQSGKMNGWRFGNNAQLPGPNSTCAAVTNPSETVIYQAERKTAAKRGTTISQAVIVEVKYDSAAAPKITFAKDDAAPAGIAGVCTISLS